MSGEHITDRNGRLLETIWELNDRFESGEDDDALDHQFQAVHQYRQEVIAAERAKIAAWLRAGEKEFSDCDIAAHLIEHGEYLK